MPKKQVPIAREAVMTAKLLSVIAEVRVGDVVVTHREGKRRVGMVKQVHPATKHVTVVCAYIDAVKGPALHDERWTLDCVVSYVDGGM